MFSTQMRGPTVSIVHKFVDDPKLGGIIGCEEDVERLQAVLDGLSEWLRISKLGRNLKKVKLSIRIKSIERQCSIK